MCKSAYSIAMEEMGRLIEKANLADLAIKNLTIDGGDFLDTYTYPDYDAGEY